MGKLSARQLVIDTLAGKKSIDIPVTVHGWGLYKFAMAGVIAGYEDEADAWAMSGEALATVEGAFYEVFHPATLHTGAGADRRKADPQKAAHLKALAREVKRLESTPVIDEYVSLISESEGEVLDSGVYSHIPILRERYGGEALLTLNEGNPLADILDPHGLLGFEEGLMALLEKPQMAAYLLFRLYDAKLARMRALRRSGADAFIGSETYCSADTISPQLFRDVILPAQRHFYRGLKEMGLYALIYFLGNLLPMLPDLVELEVDGMLVESRCKSVTLDITEIYNAVDGAFTLFGNLDSADTLGVGEPEAVEEATHSMLGRCGGGRFIMSNDCPVSFGTPRENIRVMIDTVQRYNRERG